MYSDIYITNSITNINVIINVIIFCNNNFNNIFGDDKKFNYK